MTGLWEDWGLMSAADKFFYAQKKLCKSFINLLADKFCEIDFHVSFLLLAARLSEWPTDARQIRGHVQNVLPVWKCGGVL